MARSSARRPSPSPPQNARTALWSPATCSTLAATSATSGARRPADAGQTHRGEHREADQPGEEVPALEERGPAAPGVERPRVLHGDRGQPEREQREPRQPEALGPRGRGRTAGDAGRGLVGIGAGRDRGIVVVVVGRGRAHLRVRRRPGLAAEQGHHDQADQTEGRHHDEGQRQVDRVAGHRSPEALGQVAARVPEPPEGVGIEAGPGRDERVLQRRGGGAVAAQVADPPPARQQQAQPADDAERHRSRPAVTSDDPPQHVGDHHPRHEHEGQCLGQQGGGEEQAGEDRRPPPQVAADHPREDDGEPGGEGDEQVVVVERRAHVGELRDGAHGEGRGDPRAGARPESAGRAPRREGQRGDEEGVDQAEHHQLGDERGRSAPGVQGPLDPQHHRHQLVVERWVLGLLVAVRARVVGLRPAVGVDVLPVGRGRRALDRLAPLAVGAAVVRAGDPLHRRRHQPLVVLGVLRVVGQRDDEVEVEELVGGVEQRRDHRVAPQRQPEEQGGEPDGPRRPLQRRPRAGRRPRNRPFVRGPTLHPPEGTGHGRRRSSRWRRPAGAVQRSPARVTGRPGTGRNRPTRR